MDFEAEAPVAAEPVLCLRLEVVVFFVATADDFLVPGG